MALSAIDTISVALEHTKQQLFRPFRLGQWLRLALLGLMTGELSSGGGCNGPGNFNFPHQTDTHIDPHQTAVILLILAVSLLVLGVIILLWMYVGSVYRFILIESIVTKQVRLREGWHKWQATGRRFFFWRLIYQSIASIIVVIAIGIPVGIAAALGWLSDAREHVGALVLGAIPFVLLLLLLIFALAVVALLSKDFMAPVMAMENLGFADAWRYLLAMLKREKGAYAGYVGMKIVLAIAAGIIFGIIGFFIMLMILIPFGVVGVMAVLAGKAAGLTWTVGTVTLAVVVGIIAFVLLMAVSAMLSVPVTVYFPAYSIYFFASRYPKLDAWLHPPPPQVAAPPVIPPPEPPPSVPPMSLGPEPIG